MKKLSEVEAAKAVMTEAHDWSVMKWLTEKKRVRKAADEANAALDALEKEVKSSWGDELRSAYEELSPASGEANGRSKSGKGAATIDAEVRALAQRIKQADEEAYRAHMDAENTFERAEKILSTSMAREGCKKASDSWDLHEKAIVLAEEAVARAS